MNNTKTIKVSPSSSPVHRPLLSLAGDETPSNQNKYSISQITPLPLESTSTSPTQPTQSPASTTSSSYTSPPASSTTTPPSSSGKPPLMFPTVSSSHPYPFDDFPAPPLYSGPVDPATLDSGGTEQLPFEVLQTIAARFAPIVYLHSNEQYLPVSVSSYLKDVDLMFDPTGNQKIAEYILIKSQPSEYELGHRATFLALLNDALKKHGFPPETETTFLHPKSTVRDRVHLCMRANANRRGDQAFNQVPFLVRIRKYDTHFEVVYTFMYAYNGDFNICCFWRAGAHEADMEHMTLRISSDYSRVLMIHLGAHGEVDGQWHQPQYVQMVKADIDIPTRPIIYSAINSHASYNTAGTFPRICCIANDVTTHDDTRLWGAVHSDLSRVPTPPVIMFVGNDARKGQQGEGSWMANYLGTWGSDGVSAPSTQRWFFSETSYSTNWCRRGFFVCRWLCQAHCEYKCIKRYHFPPSCYSWSGHAYDAPAQEEMTD